MPKEANAAPPAEPTPGGPTPEEAAAAQAAADAEAKAKADAEAAAKPARFRGTFNRDVTLRVNGAPQYFGAHQGFWPSAELKDAIDASEFAPNVTWEAFA